MSLSESPIAREERERQQADLRTRAEQCKRLVRALGEFAATHGVTSHPDAMDVGEFLDDLLAALTAAEQREQALREFIAKINNSVFGSQGFFTEPSAVDAIEELKAHHNRAINTLAEAERRAFEAGINAMPLTGNRWRFVERWTPQYVMEAYRAYQQSRQGNA